MFKFETKKKIREERAGYKAQLLKALDDKSAAEKERDEYKEIAEAAEQTNKIISNDKENLEKRITALNKKREELGKSNMSLGGRLGNAIRKIAKLESDLNEARNIISEQNAENSKLKNRPTLEQLKNEKVIRREKRNK